jgi:DNA replication licensing factor MCM6
MSSLFDTVLNSDIAPTPSSDAGYAHQSQRGSSARPRPPPSPSAGLNSDIGAFPDDEVVGARIPGRRAAGPRADVPKVVDVTGEALSQRFEEFLER